MNLNSAMTNTFLPDDGMDTQSWVWRALIIMTSIFVSSIFFSIAVNSISLVLMGVLWFGIMVKRRKILITSTPLDWFFLAYVAAEAVSTLFSVNQGQSLLFSKRVLLIAIVYFFASLATTRRTARWYIAVLLGSPAIVALIGIFKLVLSDPETTRRLGIFQFYMTTSELMMCAALLFAPFVIHPKTPSTIRWICMICLIPILISLYATVTRGAYLAAAAGIIFIAFVRNKKLLVPLLVLIVLVLLFAPPYVQDRLRSIVDMSHPENASRLMLWKAGLKIFADHPIVGVGDIDLHDLFVQYIPPGPEITWGHVHDVPLQILVTLGAIGFVAFVTLFVRILLTEWRIYRKVKDDWLAGSFVLGALAVLVGIHVMGLTEWSFGDQEVVLLLWTSLGLVLALGRLPSFQGDSAL